MRNIIVNLIRLFKNRLIGLCYSFRSKFDKTQNCYITCAGKIDGAGAQVQAIFSTMLFAQEFGLIYVHTPFSEMDHNQSGKEWENFLNLNKDEVIINEVNKEKLSVIYVNYPPFIRYKSNTLYVVPHCHSFADNNAHLYSDIVGKLIKKYQASSKDAFKSFYENGKVNIAVHVRRGDVSEEGINSERHTDNSHYKALLDNIKAITDELKIDTSIHLHSQGSIEDFSDLERININYHLDECIFTTFANLVSSDVLIMSKSSFSYSAALLSGAIVIYEPFWHKPLDNWLVVDKKNGGIAYNEVGLKRRLQLLNMNSAL